LEGGREKDCHLLTGSTKKRLKNLRETSTIVRTKGKGHGETERSNDGDGEEDPKRLGGEKNQQKGGEVTAEDSHSKERNQSFVKPIRKELKITRNEASTKKRRRRKDPEFSPKNRTV